MNEIDMVLDKVTVERTASNKVIAAVRIGSKSLLEESQREAVASAIADQFKKLKGHFPELIIQVE